MPFDVELPVSLTQTLARKKNTESAKWTKCWPYEYNADTETYEYRKQSSVVDNLKAMCSDIPDMAIVCCGIKTLEYDLALVNPQSRLLLTSSCKHRDKLEAFISDPSQKQKVFENQIENEHSKNVLDGIDDSGEQHKTRFATYYLISIDKKGEHAFDLERKLRENFEEKEDERKPFEPPNYISDAIKWVCGANSEGDE